MAKKIKRDDPLEIPSPEPTPEIEPSIVPEERDDPDVIPDEDPLRQYYTKYLHLVKVPDL